MSRVYNKVTARVKNNAGRTLGFVFEDDYIGYEALKGVAYEDDGITNLDIDSNGRLRIKYGRIPVINIADINQAKYKEYCGEHDIKRNGVQSQLKGWKANHRDKVLYVSGANQVGKTTEIRKFSYLNYEQAFYIDMAADRGQHSVRNGIRKCIMKGEDIGKALIRICRSMKWEPFINDENTLIIIDDAQEEPEVFTRVDELKAGLKCDVAVISMDRALPDKDVYEVRMKPLTYKEVCWELFNRCAVDEYNELGGYPEAIVLYKRSKSLNTAHVMLDRVVGLMDGTAAYQFNGGSIDYEIVLRSILKRLVLIISRQGGELTKSDLLDIVTNINSSPLRKAEVRSADILAILNWMERSDWIGRDENGRYHFLDCGMARSICDSYGGSGIKQIVLDDTFEFGGTLK